MRRFLPLTSLVLVGISTPVLAQSPLPAAMVETVAQRLAKIKTPAKTDWEIAEAAPADASRPEELRRKSGRIEGFIDVRKAYEERVKALFEQRAVEMEAAGKANLDTTMAEVARVQELLKRREVERDAATGARIVAEIMAYSARHSQDYTKAYKPDYYPRRMPVDDALEETLWAHLAYVNQTFGSKIGDYTMSVLSDLARFYAQFDREADVITLNQRRVAVAIESGQLSRQVDAHRDMAEVYEEAGREADAARERAAEKRARDAGGF